MRAIIHKVLSNTLVYTCALIVMAFLYVFPFTISFATSAVKIFLIWGGAIFLYDIIVNRVLFQKKIFWVVFAFFVVTGISALVNFRNGLMRNGVFTLYGGWFPYCWTGGRRNSRCAGICSSSVLCSSGSLCWWRWHPL